MIIDIFDLIINIEESFSNYYGQLKNLTRFYQFKETFELMKTVSDVHCEKIKEMKSTYQLPVFNRKAVLDIIQNFKDHLWKEIVDERDEEVIIKKLAKTEEDVGKLYSAISLYFLNVSVLYKDVADKIKIISGEEMDHRDALLKLQKPT